MKKFILNPQVSNKTALQILKQGSQLLASFDYTQSNSHNNIRLDHFIELAKKHNFTYSIVSEGQFGHCIQFNKSN